MGMSPTDVESAIKRLQKRIYYYRENMDRELEEYATRELEWLYVKKQKFDKEYKGFRTNMI